MSKKYFSYLLAIPALSSLTPSEHEIRVFDENIEEIDYTWEADLAGITARTMFVKRAYQISDNFRKRGVKTVLGGIHPSMCTKEALQFCDTVVVGEAEHVWHSLLDDARNGGMKRIYKVEEKADLTSFPVPDRSCLSKEKYFTDIVQTTKGCPFNCEFCSVYAFDGQRIRSRTIDQVLEEIQEISGSENQYKKKSIFFADDNIIANRKFARELFAALKQYNLNWSCQASINISRDDEILRLMKESGCGAILIGLESISEDNLSSMQKNVNLRHDYVSAIEKIQSYGIMVHSSFIVGYDFETQSSLDELAEFIEEANLIMALMNVLTPLPGTKLFDRFEREGRLLHKDWDKYDGVTVVFKPKLMTPEELEEGHRRIIQKVYSFDSIYRKLKHYWDIDFWKHSNEVDPIKFRLRFLFALRLLSLLASGNIARSKFILKILPKVFQKRVRISTILTLMAYNDFAFSL